MEEEALNESAQTKDQSDWRKTHDIQKHVLTETALCIDAIFKLENELKQKHHSVSVEYSISQQEGSYIFFARFYINKGLTKIERTFLFDIWHDFAGFENNRSYIENEIKKFRNSLNNSF